MNKFFFKIREDIHTPPIEVNFESRGIAQEELIFSDTIDLYESKEEQLWKHR